MKSDRFRQVLADIGEALRGGETLLDAVAQHADVFPDFYITILRSAELTGHVDAVLDQLPRTSSGTKRPARRSSRR